MHEMDVPERVHVMPVGYEFDRVVEAAKRLQADRVVLLAYADDTDHPSYVAEIAAALEDAGIDWEKTTCDIFDFYDSIGTIAEAVTRYADHAVSVNLASGSKVTAIGGMIACMATDATPYYVRAERYADQSEGSVAEGVRAIHRLPTYPMDIPSAETIAVLQHVVEAGPVTKKELIELGEREGLPFVADYDSEELKGKYRRLDAHVLDSLSDRGCVTVEAVGRRKQIDATETGEDTLRAFSYLLA